MIFLSAAGESFFQLIFALVVFVGVLALTAYVTKWVAGYQKTQGLNRNLEIVEAIKVGNNKFIQIIRAGEDRYYIIAVGKDEINTIGEISSSELKEFTDESQNIVPQIDFKSILDKISKKEK